MSKPRLEDFLSAWHPASEERRNAALVAALSALNDSPPKVRKLGTKRQAAEILDAHPRTVDRYAKAGLLQPIRYSCRRIRWDLTACARLAAEGLKK